MTFNNFNSVLPTLQRQANLIILFYLMSEIVLPVTQSFKVLKLDLMTNIEFSIITLPLKRFFYDSFLYNVMYRLGNNYKLLSK